LGEILLTEDEIDRYARQLVLRDIGLRGQERLKSSRVAILGMGGLGTPAALLLTRMGIGFIRIVDRDIVSGTDLHRQVLFNLDDVGLPKVEAAKTSLNKMNPDVEIDAIAIPILNENIDKLIEDVDLIIDGLDNIRTRYIINRAALRMGKPYIFSAAVEMFGIVSTIIPGETPCLECFYSGLQDEFLPRCAVVGVHPSITFITSAIAVSEATKLIVSGEPSLKGKLLFIDLRSMDFNLLELKRDENCGVCGRGVAPEIEQPLVELGCARDGKSVYFINKFIDGFNMDEAVTNILKIGSITRMGDQFIKFKIDESLQGTLFKSGSMIIEVSGMATLNEREIIGIYESISNVKIYR